MATRSGGKYRAWIRPFRHWWKPLVWVWGVLILGVFINDGSSWLITKSFEVSGTPLGWLFGHPEITLPLVGTLILLTCLAGLAYRQENVSTVQADQRSALPPQQRLQVLHTLYQEYSDRLDHSLQGSVALNLELHKRTDMIVSPTSLVFRDLETGEASPLPRGTSILQVYDRMQSGMLILGAPGSGKTTLLLTLARGLLLRAKNNPDLPLVIILNLSSWSRTRLPLAQWLVQQCTLTYGIPKRLAATWIEQEQVQFLLDGLDEMRPSARITCIGMINTYRQAHLIPLVVCSRSQDYESQPERLILPGAVEIQPLEPAQILQVLQSAGKSFAAVQAALRSNTILKGLLTTPLMLNIVILTYRNKTQKDLPQRGSPKEQQREIFEHYVQNMLRRYQQRRNFSLAQTTHSLVWLARQMQQHHMTEFHLESLQADWLSARYARIIYRLIVGLIVGLSIGLSVGLNVGLNVDLTAGLNIQLLAGLLTGLLAGLLAGAIIGLDDITPVEKFTWLGLVAGPVAGLLTGLFLGSFGGSFGGLFFRLSFGLLLGVVFGLGVGLSFTPLAKNVRLKPNQGIRTSGWNAVRLGLVFGLVAGLLVGQLVGLVAGLLVGLLVGQFVGLLTGGEAYFQHFVLRLILAQSRALPWNAVSFLEETRRCILLQRVGGGYRFIHPLLQEYFAALATSPAISSSSASKKSIVIP